MRRQLRRLLTPLVFAVSLGVTWLAWQHEQHNAARDQEAALDFTLRANIGRITQGMAAYQQMLRGVQGLFAASAEVEPYEFRAYVEALQLDANFSGIDGIGILPAVLPAARDTHVAMMRRRGYADYSIRPAGARELYAPLIQVEPFSAANRARYGLDWYADAASRHPMDLARDTDEPFITGKIEQASDSGAGFRMFLPLYKKGMPHDTISVRRANLVGWVAATFRMNQLMASLYGERGRGVDIRLYDGINLTPAALLYASAGPDESDGDGDGRRLEYIEVGGRTWVLAVNAGAEQGAPGRNRARLIALAGLSLSLLLALLTWTLVSGRERAFTLATGMTAALRASETRYRHLAQHDTLTGLPNLALFSDRLQQALIQAPRSHARLAVLFLDLDQFKPINDALGHHVGDLLLQAVAARLRESLRESDTVARIGGDEFVLLLPTIHEPSEALTLAELVRDALSQPFDMSDGQRLSISCSIGVAVYPEHGDDGTQLLKNADQAMYRAKRGGRNKVRLFKPPPAEKAATV